MSFVVAYLAHTFVPRHSNSFKARFLGTQFLFLLFFAFIFFQRYVVDSVSSPQILGYASQISISEVINLTNAQREKAGLSKVIENPLLNKAASEKGAHMLKNNYWAHVAPDGTQPWDFFKSVGYKYKYAGENLARDFSNPSSAVSAWMASASHKENLLSPNYQEIGVAVVEGQLNGKEATIIVQLFGTSISPTKAAVAVAKTPEPSIPPVEEKKVEIPALSISTTNLSETQVSPQIPLSRIVSITLIAVLLFAAFIDASILWSKGLSRKGGRPLAQIAFLSMILVAILVAKAEQIL